MFRTYQKTKPAEAVQFVSENYDWISENLSRHVRFMDDGEPEDVAQTVGFLVETKEGTMEGKVGDYIMRGIKGELYICDRDIFMDSYQAVAEGVTIPEPTFPPNQVIAESSDVPMDVRPYKQYGTEIRIVFKPNDDNPDLLFVEVEDEHGCSMVEPGKWRTREDGFRELVLRVVVP